jgi:hypothetical protein
VLEADLGQKPLGVCNSFFGPCIAVEISALTVRAGNQIHSVTELLQGLQHMDLFETPAAWQWIALHTAGPSSFNILPVHLSAPWDVLAVENSDLYFSAAHTENPFV